MLQKEIRINYSILKTTELSDNDSTLVEKAKEATYNSYAKYSDFHVGAALLLDNGDIVTGANQENASYPCGICAERSALYAAQSQHPKAHIVAIAIAARNGADEPSNEAITPCGLCRQALLEVEQRQQAPIRLLLASKEEVIAVESVASLLPLSFSIGK